MTAAAAARAVLAMLMLPTLGGCATTPAPSPSTYRGCPAVPAPPRGSAGPVTVVVGASIADGFRTSAGERAAWPHLLAEWLRGDRSASPIVNYSVSAARLLVDTPGQRCSSALHREEPALRVRNIRTLVLTDLVNDIQQPPHVHDPGAIISGLKEFTVRARARNVRVVVSTIAPYQGFVSFEPQGERTRRAVNEAIRHGGFADGVLDADAVLRDPAHSSRLRPAYDCGDHLHLGDAGQRALARSIPANMLTPGAPNG